MADRLSPKSVPSVKRETDVFRSGGALPVCRTVPLSRALSLEGEPVPIIQHQHVLLLPRPRLRSCRRPFSPSPTSGRYRLPRPVLDRLLGEAAPLRNGEAVVLLATFVARFQTGPRCLGRSFPLDRRVLAAHPALGLSEARVRGALAALVALGFLEAEEAAPGRRYQRTVEGLHRRAVLYRVAPIYRELFTAANRTPRRAPGRAVGGRRALAAPPMPAAASRASRSPPETRPLRSPKDTESQKPCIPLGEVKEGLPRASSAVPEARRDSGVEAALRRLGELVLSDGAKRRER